MKYLVTYVVATYEVNKPRLEEFTSTVQEALTPLLINGDPIEATPSSSLRNNISAMFDCFQEGTLNWTPIIGLPPVSRMTDRCRISCVDLPKSGSRLKLG